jgi:copper(I)-binding protein
VNCRKLTVTVTIILAALFAPEWNSIALAGTQGAQGLEVTRLWSRATPPGAMAGVIYADIFNNTGDSVELVGVSTPVASHAEVHESVSVDGMMKMRKRESIAISGGDQLRLSPGGLHIMLMGLQKPLVAGDEFELTLHFSDLPEISLTVPVLPVTQIAYPESE